MITLLLTSIMGVEKSTLAANRNAAQYRKTPLTQRLCHKAESAHIGTFIHPCHKATIPHDGKDSIAQVIHVLRLKEMSK